MAHRWVEGGSAKAARKMVNSAFNSAIRGAKRMGRTRTTSTRAKRVVVYHSIRLHLLLCLVGIGVITIPYITLSPGHRWKK